MTLYGVDVRDVPLDVLRAQVGMALQETVLFSGSVRDNIRYGRPEASEAEIVDYWRAVGEVCRIVGVEDGFRAISNTRGDGVQEVPHLHVHIIGGRPLGRTTRSPLSRLPRPAPQIPSVSSTTAASLPSSPFLGLGGGGG